MKKLIIFITILLLIPLFFSVKILDATNNYFIPTSSTVAVFPLTYNYQVVQDYTRTVIQTDATLKGHFKEDGRFSSKSSDRFHDSETRHSSSSHSNVSDSYSHKASGNYDLNATKRISGESFKDRTIVEKQLDTNRLTGIIESAISSAGYSIVDRSAMNKVFAEREKMSDPEFSPTAIQAATKMKISDYILSGQLLSYRVDGVRTVPDGSNRRYAISGVVKASIKIINAQDGTSNFSRTITGQSRKTFDVSDPVPYESAMDEAMEDFSSQLANQLIGKTQNLTDDEIYQDSPGKRLKQ
jgi:hypothetical protein